MGVKYNHTKFEQMNSTLAAMNTVATGSLEFQSLSKMPTKYPFDVAWGVLVHGGGRRIVYKV